MCGRYALNITPNQLVRQFHLDREPPRFERYNIAPTQPVPAVRAREATPRELTLLHWGLIPGWAKDASIGNRMINARSETITSKPVFREAFQNRRCLLPASGFYEWKKLADGKRKQPMFIHMADGSPFGLAGVWEQWQEPGGNVIASCAVLTTNANEFMQPIHDRMPVIIAQTDYDRWLEPAGDESDRLQELLRPCPSEAMAAHAVSPRVNNPRFDKSECMAPTQEQGRLF